MKEITVRVIRNDVWEVSDRGEEVPDCVCLKGPGLSVAVASESSIQHEWPMEVRDAVRSAILKGTEWTVGEYGDSDDPEAVVIRCRGKYAGHYGRKGIDQGTHTVPMPHWPAHILAEAAAKFRAGYVLKDDEVWVGGLPKRMKFDAGWATVDLGPPTDGIYWDETVRQQTWCRSGVFLDETERLAAFDRMRAFYYQEHPGKALLPHNADRVLTFEMRGDYGVATSALGVHVDTDHGVDVESVWAPILAKLRRWTDAQLAKGTKKVTMEGRIHVAGSTLVLLPDHIDPSLDRKHVRVTIEAVND